MIAPSYMINFNFSFPFSIDLPSDQYATSHLRFFFIHRSRHAWPKPYAMSFLKLVSDHDETAIKDQTHELIVYEIGDKVDLNGNPFYLDMPFYKAGSTYKGSKYVNVFYK